MIQWQRTVDYIIVVDSNCTHSSISISKEPNIDKNMKRDDETLIFLYLAKFFHTQAAMFCSTKATWSFKWILTKKTRFHQWKKNCCFTLSWIYWCILRVKFWNVYYILKNKGKPDFGDNSVSENEVQGSKLTVTILLVELLHAKWA